MTHARRQGIVLGLLISSCGASGTPNPTEPDVLRVALRIEALPPREIDGSARLHASVRAGDAELDLGEIGVDAESCAPRDVPDLVEIGQDPAADDAQTAAFACTGIHTGWSVVLVQRGQDVDVLTQIRDEDEGEWQLNTLPLPSDAEIRLSDGELEITSPAQK